MNTNTNIEKGISVIICCYNSVTRLYETLRHLALQKTDSALPYEIIVIDNASTDNTGIFATETWQQLKNDEIVFKVIEEIQPGLSFARQCGVKEAKYEYIIFCDDDNWLRQDYLQTAFELMTSDSSIGALGGISTAASDKELPEWFEKYSHAYATGNQSGKAGYVNERGYVAGAGLVTRKFFFEETVNNDFPSILTDRKGTALSGGGDVEYCLRIILLGFNIYYSDKLVFKHFIPAYRLTETYRDNLLKGAADAQWILKEYFEAARIKRASNYTKLQLTLNAFKDFIKSVLKRRKPNSSTSKLAYYFFNIGFKDRHDLAIIKHFYKYNYKVSRF